MVGGWSKYTYLKWRWSEFRFETRFATPTFAMLPSPNNMESYDRFPYVDTAGLRRAPKKRNWRKRFTWRSTVSRSVYLTGGVQSRLLSCLEAPADLEDSIEDDENFTADSAGWLRFLSSLQDWQRKTTCSKEDLASIVGDLRLLAINPMSDLDHSVLTQLGLDFQKISDLTSERQYRSRKGHGISSLLGLLDHWRRSVSAI